MSLVADKSVDTSIDGPRSKPPPCSIPGYLLLGYDRGVQVGYSRPRTILKEIGDSRGGGTCAHVPELPPVADRWGLQRPPFLPTLALGDPFEARRATAADVARSNLCKSTCAVSPAAPESSGIWRPRLPARATPQAPRGRVPLGAPSPRPAPTESLGRGRGRCKGAGQPSQPGMDGARALGGPPQGSLVASPCAATILASGGPPRVRGAGQDLRPCARALGKDEATARCAQRRAATGGGANGRAQAGWPL
eukprot:scaffold1353_cov417-Prasinococcus_capsulatus_cf.AAC.3